MKVYYISYKIDDLNSVCEHISANDLVEATQITESKGQVNFVEEVQNVVINN